MMGLAFARMLDKYLDRKGSIRPAEAPVQVTASPRALPSPRRPQRGAATARGERPE